MHLIHDLKELPNNNHPVNSPPESLDSDAGEVDCSQPPQAASDTDAGPPETGEDIEVQVDSEDNTVGINNNTVVGNNNAPQASENQEVTVNINMGESQEEIDIRLMKLFSTREDTIRLAKLNSHLRKKRTDRELVGDYKFALQILHDYKTKLDWEVRNY
jgi:hypothetical protein